MYDDENDQYGFWHDEPTGPIERIAARRRPAGPAPEPPVRRRPPEQPQVGSRSHGHTTQIPVVAGAVHSVRSATQHVDPLLRRMGLLLVVTALAIPVALGVRGGGADTSSLQAGPTSLPIGTVAAIDATVADTVVADDLTVAPVGDAEQVAATVSTIDIDALPPAVPVNTRAPVTTAAAADATQAPPSATQPTRSLEATPAVTTACKKYEVVAGDYWILIADKVSVSVGDLLAVNGASTSTGLYPGRTICLPNNASAPTTAKPTTTTARATPTTAKPTATTTPAAPAPKATYTRAEVESIIRSVWPDELETEALRIATRESNLQPGVRNFCCFGLFQIYFNVHKGWLATIGVTNAEQLYDPWVNARAAYTLYQRAGGWGPWKL